MAPPQTTKKQQTCPRCTEVATKSCSTCKNIKYCSPECQQADWPSHKSLCKNFKEFTEPRPSGNMKRVVVILPGEPKPRFMWAPLNDGHCGSKHVWPAMFLDYSPKSVDWKNIESSKNVWTGKPLGYVVQVWYDDKFLMNFDASNPGSALFAATQGQVTTPWCGPIVVCRQTLPKEDWNDDVGEDEWQGTVKVLDMDMAAFSQATSMLIDHASGTSRHGFGKGKKLQCVELACGRQGENPKPHTVMLLPRTHPMLEEEPEISGVSERLQETLISWKVDSKPGTDTQINPKFMALYVGCDPTLPEPDDVDSFDDMFGYTDLPVLCLESEEIGTHLVARADGKPLKAETVDAMADFCRFHLGPYFLRCRKSCDDEDLDVTSPRRFEHRQKVMNEITPEKWSTYLAQWKVEQTERTAAKSRGDLVYTIEKARAGLERMGLTQDDSDRVRCILFDMHDQHIEAYVRVHGGD